MGCPFKRTIRPIGERRALNYLFITPPIFQKNELPAFNYFTAREYRRLYHALRQQLITERCTREKITIIVHCNGHYRGKRFLSVFQGAKTSGISAVNKKLLVVYLMFYRKDMEYIVNNFFSLPIANSLSLAYLPPGNLYNVYVQLTYSVVFVSGKCLYCRFAAGGLLHR